MLLRSPGRPSTRSTHWKHTAGLVPVAGVTRSRHIDARESAAEGVVAGEGFEPSTFGL